MEHLIFLGYTQKKCISFTRKSEGLYTEILNSLKLYSGKRKYDDDDDDDDDDNDYDDYVFCGIVDHWECISLFSYLVWET